jgi:hypothetical protein
MKAALGFSKPAARKLTGILAVTMIVTGVVFMPFSQAYADDGTPPPPSGEQLDQKLQACLERLNEWYEVQEGNMEKAANAIDKIEAAIDKAQSLGIDTGQAEALLASARSQLAAAEDKHEVAGAILNAHAGFGSDGRVLDREQAGDTCRTGRDALANARDALRDMREIGRELRQIAREWRQTHRQAPVPEGG